MPKTWKQKLDGGSPAHVETLEKAFGGVPAGAKMLVATPRLVDDFMRGVPPGEALSVGQMRDALAARHGADITCALSTGIFARIAAEAALDELRAGARASEVTPFWRVVDANSALARKLSCGPEFIETQRRLEAGPPPRDAGRSAPAKA